MTKQRRPFAGTRIAGGAIAAALCLAAPAAHAADCSSLNGGEHIVYVAGSTAAKPFVAALAGALQKLSTPIMVVYQGQGSCVGAGYFDKNGTGAGITNIGTFWSPEGVEDANGCDLDLAPGTPVDIGVSDVWADTCGVTLADGVTDTTGPIQSMTFVVPNPQSQQKAISMEAAYLTFGLGADGEVSPWLDPTTYEVRSASSGTQMMIASVIGVPGGKWKGNAQSGGGAVVSALAADVTNNKGDQAIGILASDVADKNRAALRILAYQHKDQSCGFLPDSSETAFDKQNVRDGHYMIWGPLHMFVKSDNPDVKTVVDALHDPLTKAPDGLDLLQIEAHSSVVPECAMHVKRTSEGGALMSYMPPHSCECKFLAEATGNAPTECKACSGDGDCSGDRTKCNAGYCEVQ